MSAENNSKQIELLAPAGSEDAFFAAVAAGADAIYLGTNQFNARERAENISIERLPFLVKIAHAHNVRVYLTLNIVFFDDEFSDAYELVSKAVKAGIDAVIIQDLGMAAFIREHFPTLELHASTQLTTHNIAQCSMLADSGFSQINLSRELSLEEIKPVADFLNEHNICTEVFIHGAYCISFSGQCYFSGGLNGLKGNRGQCVQPCRRNYCSMEDAKGKAPQSFFNLKDNCVFPIIDRLAEACGMRASFKIEGRIKSAEYVYAVTSAWREQIDRLLKGEPLSETDERLSGSMNRGFSTGYLQSNISKEMFTDGMRDHSWIDLGLISGYNVGNSCILIEENDEISKLTEKDEVSVYDKNGSFICNAGICNIANSKITSPGNKTGEKTVSIKIRIKGKLNGKILKGCRLYRIRHFLFEEEFERIKQKLIETGRSSVGSENEKPLLDVEVSGKNGEPLSAVFSCGDFQTSVQSDEKLAPAQNKSLTKAVLEEKLFKLGNSPFTAGRLNCGNLEANLFLPLSSLNAMRQKAVSALEEALSAAQKRRPSTSDSNDTIRTAAGRPNPPDDSLPVSSLQKKAVTLISIDDAERTDIKPDEEHLSALEMPVTLSDEKTYQRCLNLIKEKQIMPYFPAILFDQDFSGALNLLSELKNDGLKQPVISENAGLMKTAFELGFQVIPGFHLNLTNSHAVKEFCRIFNCPAIILSTELNETQEAQIHLPKGVEVYYLTDKSGESVSKRFLMQSRQCLVSRASGCTKKATDRECLLNCEKQVVLSPAYNTGCERIIARKRRGFYSELVKAPVKKAP